MEYLKDGTFDTKFLVTHRVKLEDFPALYGAFDKRFAGKSFPHSLEFQANVQ